MTLCSTSVVMAGLFVGAAGPAQPPKDAPPPEAQLAALRKEIAALDKNLTAQTEELAREIVAVTRLQAQFEAAALIHQTMKTTTDVLAEAIQKAERDGEGQVAIGQRKMTLAEAKRTLADITKAYERNRKPFVAQEATLEARVAGRDALQKRLIAVKAHREALSEAIDGLDVELRLLRPKDGAKVDDAKLAEIKKQLSDLQKKLDVEREKLKLTGPEGDEKPKGKEKAVDDILKGLGPKKP